MKEDFSYIGQNILWLRKRNFITQEQLGLEAFITTDRISNFETGKAIPTCEEIIHIANFFGVSFDVLLKEDGVSKIPESRFYEVKKRNDGLKQENDRLKRRLKRR